MTRSASVDEDISLFRSRIQNRRFDDVTFRVLESILVSKVLESSIGVRSVLRQFMRDESLVIFGEITEESVEIKLMCSEFLTRALAIIGDIESCLTLRYEALVMRYERATAHPGLHVTCKEWLTFAEHSLENGFYSIANQACEKALMSSRVTCVAHFEMDDTFHDVHTIKKIKGLKDMALLKISSQSVRALAESHLKQKRVEQNIKEVATSILAENGSSRFRRGIIKHNLRKLHYYQCLRNPDAGNT